ncbi:MAG: hemolysin family protein [Acidobacteriota bacterium]
MPWLLVSFACCLLGSAFFSFSETCLTSLSESKAKAVQDTWGRRGEVLTLWRESPQGVLTTILIGNNVTNVLAPVLLSELMRAMLGEDRVAVALAWASSITTFMLLVFGEITPKTLARQHSERLAVPVMTLLAPIHSLLRPATWVFVRLARLAVRMFGGELSGAQGMSAGEIQAAIDLGQRAGVLDRSRARALNGVFALADTPVREIMVARPEMECLDLEGDAGDLVERVSRTRFSRLPVVRGHVDEVVGVLHVKDLLRELARGAEPSTRLLRRLSRQPLFVPETTRLDRLLGVFQSDRQHLAVVLDEHGGTAGVVSLEDILEELVGEIHDEHDTGEEMRLVPAGTSRWVAPGRLPIAVLQRQLGLELPREPGYETLAGLLMDLAGHVPIEGSRWAVGGLRFEILVGDERRLDLLRIERQ